MMAAAAWKTRPATVATSTDAGFQLMVRTGGRRDQLAAGIQELAQQKRRNPGIAFNHAKQAVSRDRIFGRLLFFERADADAIRICRVEAFDIVRRPSHGLRLESALGHEFAKLRSSWDSSRWLSWSNSCSTSR